MVPHALCVFRVVSGLSPGADDQQEVLDVDDEQLELWTSKTAASGYLGVVEQRGTFVARYGQTRGNDNNLGTFGTAREAAVAYARARLKAEAAGRAAAPAAASDGDASQREID